MYGELLKRIWAVEDSIKARVDQVNQSAAAAITTVETERRLAIDTCRMAYGNIAKLEVEIRKLAGDEKLPERPKQNGV